MKIGWKIGLIVIGAMITLMSNNLFVEIIGLTLAITGGLIAKT